MTEHEKTIQTVLDVITEMLKSNQFDDETLEELAQRIV